MQPVKWTKIIEQAAADSGMDEAVLRSMSDFVFRDKVVAHIKGMDNLSIQLMGIVTFFFGRKRLQQFYPKVLRHIELEEAGTRRQAYRRKSYLSSLNLEELYGLKEKLEARLQQYEQYVKDKQQARNDRTKPVDE